MIPFNDHCASFCDRRGDDQESPELPVSMYLTLVKIKSSSCPLDILPKLKFFSVPRTTWILSKVKKYLRLTRYPNLMVDSWAWMMDHKPQKKWDASENLQHKDTKCFLLPFSFSLQYPMSLCEVTCLCTLSSPVDLHVQLFFQLHLVLCAQAVEPLIWLAQVALDEVELRGNISCQSAVC